MATTNRSHLWDGAHPVALLVCGIVVAAWAAGCVFDDSEFAQQFCQTSEECGEGSECRAGVCVSLGGGDALIDLNIDQSGNQFSCGTVECAPGEECCGLGSCVDLTVDTENCGGCGVRCGEGLDCVGGVCLCGGETCGFGDACCDGSCIAVDVDRSNCGSCGWMCATDELCISGQCLCEGAGGATVTCTTEQQCCPGVGCRNLLTDSSSCGGCGLECQPGEVCNGGLCECAPGVSCIADECCAGGASKACFAVDEPECSCGGVACVTGQACCAKNDGSGEEACASLLTDPFNCGACGAQCLPGESCTSGSCVISCQEGLTDCSGVCVDMDRDNSNCGACGKGCDPGQVCSNGNCGLSCQQVPIPLINCGGTCIDPATSRDFCGASGDCNGANDGTACGAGQVCNGAVCSVTCQQVPIPLINCNGTCIDPKTNLQFCGASGDCTGANDGTTCATGQVCANGTCNLTCQAGLMKCGTYCRDLQTDPNNCGNCGRACGGGEVCSAGNCLLSCQAGLVQCGGKCIDPRTNREFCGADELGNCTNIGAGNSDGDVCADGQVCNSGACSVSCQQVPIPLINCSGTCIDPKTNRDYCGASGNCTNTGAGNSDGDGCASGQVCTNGACNVSCQSGLTLCPLEGFCRDLQNDPLHCGSCTIACQSGQVCQSGQCSLTCQSGLVNCGGTCIDPNTNNTYCGAQLGCSGAGDGTVCSASQLCKGGTCQINCPPPFVICSGACVDPRNDRTYCGATTGACTGKACGDGQICSGSQCQCAQGLTDCPALGPLGCVDTKANNQYCSATSGSCGSACAAGQVCSNGTCSVSCQSGLVNCGGTCIDPQTNKTYCGASGTCSGGSAGTTCSGDLVCINSACNCPTGLTKCGTSCVDTDVDPSNCGGCGGSPRACTAGEVCSGGACVVTCLPPTIKCGSTCIDPRVDRTYCGASGSCSGGTVGTTCTGDLQCINSACNCPAGLTKCVTSCVDTDVDPSNCGGCGGSPRACTAGEVCSGGACAVTCLSPTIKCGSTCIDPRVDRTYCGASGSCSGGTVGTPCTGDLHCINSQCNCPASLSKCGTSCVNLDSDLTHCGGCGTDCTAVGTDYVCNGAGVCALLCEPDLDKCGTTCVDFATDPSNCGGCAGSCTGQEVCISGSCDCQAGLTSCGSAGSEVCVNIQTDEDYCGDCSSVCADGAYCISGACDCAGEAEDCVVPKACDPAGSGANRCTGP